MACGGGDAEALGDAHDPKRSGSLETGADGVGDVDGEVCQDPKRSGSAAATFPLGAKNRCPPISAV